MLHESQLAQLAHPDEQGRHLSCCWSQYVPPGHEGIAPVNELELDEEDEELDELELEEDEFVVVSAGAGGGVGGGMATHLVPSQTCAVVQMTQVTPL